MSGSHDPIEHQYLASDATVILAMDCVRDLGVTMSNTKFKELAREDILLKHESRLVRCRSPSGHEINYRC